MGNPIQAAGNFANAVGHVVTDTVEDVVQETGIGKVSESLGFKVQGNIYKNGLNTESTGAVAFAVSGGSCDKITTTLKVKTKDGDFGAKGDASEYNGKVKVGNAGFTIDNRGVSANADVGPVISSSIKRVNSPKVIDDMIEEMFAQLLTVSGGDQVKDLVQYITNNSPEQIFHFLLDTTFELYFGGLMEEICSGLLEDLGEYVSIHMQLECGATMGISASMLLGQVQEVEYTQEGKIDADKIAFNIFKAGGKFAVEGWTSAYGLLHSEKGMDGYDQQVSWSNDVAINGATVKATIWIGFYVDGPANENINKIKKMFL